MSVNLIQVGGTHYKTDYQHWDFVCDLNLNYLMGCLTKYVTRYKKKNGLEDLNKAVHYCQKQVERIKTGKTQLLSIFHEVTLPQSLVLFTTLKRRSMVSMFISANFPNSTTIETEALAASIFHTLCKPYTEDSKTDSEFEEAIVDCLTSAIPKIQNLISILTDEANEDRFLHSCSSEPTSAYTNQG